MALTLTNNSPSSGYISWTACNMQYKGVNYGIPAGNTNNVYVYWNASSPNAFQTANTLPTLGLDDCIVFLNKSGTAVNALTATILDGDLIAPGSILSNAIAANTITGGNIAASTITGNNIAAATISASNIVANTISSNLIAANAIGTAALAAQAVTADKIAANTITAAQIASQTITANQIAANTITANQIAANTITANQIAAGTISAAQIAANAIGANQLAASCITANNISSLNGLNVGNGNFVIDSSGNVTLKGSIASGSTISGATITGSTFTTPGGSAGSIQLTADTLIQDYQDVDGDMQVRISTGQISLSLGPGGTSPATHQLIIDYYGNLNFTGPSSSSYEIGGGGITSKDTSGNNFAIVFDTPSKEMQISADGGVYVNSPMTVNTPIAKLAHTSLALVNSWVNMGGSYDNAVYTKSADGFVTLKGLIKGGAVGSTIATLPAGYRPWNQRLFACTDGTNGAGRVDVYSNGNIVLAAAGSTSYISLSNITFLAEN